MQDKKTVIIKERVAQLVEELTPAEQAVVLRLLRVIIANRSKKHSIMELEGLGRELWEGIDAQEYLDQLRGPKCW